MPNNVIDSAKDEKKWKKAEGIAEDKLGHKPKSDKDWAYVMGIYKNMKPDHKFKSDKSASSVVDQWMARRVAVRKRDIQKFYDAVERGLIQRPKGTTFGHDHIYLWFSERFSGGWHIDFEANIRTDGRRVWLEIQDDRKKYNNPAQAAKAINERRDLEIELNDIEGFRTAASKTAGFGLLDQVLDTRGVMDALRHLKGVDDQSADLLVEVVYRLEDAMDLKSSELAALKRMQWVAKNKRGDYAMLRNNIFKAANSLGIKLPSGMFASTKIPALNRTAAEPWVIVYGPRGEKVGMPTSWLKGGLSRYDVHAAEVGGSELKRQADLVIGPGTHRDAMKNIDYLHGAVNDIYDLVDEGYVDGKKAIIAFK